MTVHDRAALEKARDLLADITPLHMDCGSLCGQACCRDSDDSLNGMLLFPGEDALPLPQSARLIPTEYEAAGQEILLMTCDGRCDRSTRPLACRIFPLMLAPRKQGGFTLRMDERARFCPLHDSGSIGLQKAFLEAVEGAFALLMECPAQRAFLDMLAQEQRELRALAKGFGL